MSGRMNWDRVRMEGKARSHGSEWIDASSSILTPSGQLVLTAKQKAKFKGKTKSHPFAGLPKMPGCTCGKPFGFKGEHRKSCALRVLTKASMPTPVRPTAISSVQTKASLITLAEFGAAMKLIHRDTALQDFLFDSLRALVDEPKMGRQQKEAAERAIMLMLKELNAGQKKAQVSTAGR